MKKYLLIVPLFFCLVSYSQVFIPKAGVTASKLATDAGHEKLKWGYTAGLAVNIQTNKKFFSIQPEINFIQKGSKFRATGYDQYNDFTDYTVTRTLHYIELPVLAKFAFGNKTKFFVNAGPSFSWGVGGTILTHQKDIINGQTSVTDKNYQVVFGKEAANANQSSFDNAFDLGAQVGAGVIVSHLMIEFRYGLGLTNLDDENSYGFLPKLQNRTLQFSVGVPINMRGKKATDI